MESVEASVRGSSSSPAIRFNNLTFTPLAVEARACVELYANINNIVFSVI